MLILMCKKGLEAGGMEQRHMTPNFEQMGHWPNFLSKCWILEWQWMDGWMV